MPNLFELAKKAIQNRFLSIAALFTTAIAPVAAKTADNAPSAPNQPAVEANAQAAEEAATVYFYNVKYNYGVEGPVVSVYKDSEHKVGDVITVKLNKKDGSALDVKATVVTQVNKNLKNVKGSELKNTNDIITFVGNYQEVLNQVGHEPTRALVYKFNAEKAPAPVVEAPAQEATPVTPAPAKPAKTIDAKPLQATGIITPSADFDKDITAAPVAETKKAEVAPATTPAPTAEIMPPSAETFVPNFNSIDLTPLTPLPQEVLKAPVAEAPSAPETKSPQQEVKAPVVATSNTTPFGYFAFLSAAAGLLLAVSQVIKSVRNNNKKPVETEVSTATFPVKAVEPVEAVVTEAPAKPFDQLSVLPGVLANAPKLTAKVDPAFAAAAQAERASQPYSPLPAAYAKATAKAAVVAAPVVEAPKAKEAIILHPEFGTAESQFVTTEVPAVKIAAKPEVKIAAKAPVKANTAVLEALFDLPPNIAGLSSESIAGVISAKDFVTKTSLRDQVTRIAESTVVTQAAISPLPTPPASLPVAPVKPLPAITEPAEPAASPERTTIPEMPAPTTGERQDPVTVSFENKGVDVFYRAPEIRSDLGLGAAPVKGNYSRNFAGGLANLRDSLAEVFIRAASSIQRAAEERAIASKAKSASKIDPLSVASLGNTTIVPGIEEFIALERNEHSSASNGLKTFAPTVEASQVEAAPQPAETEVSRDPATGNIVGTDSPFQIDTSNTETTLVGTYAEPVVTNDNEASPFTFVETATAPVAVPDFIEAPAKTVPVAKVAEEPKTDEPSFTINGQPVVETAPVAAKTTSAPVQTRAPYFRTAFSRLISTLGTALSAIYILPLAIAASRNDITGEEIYPTNKLPNEREENPKKAEPKVAPEAKVAPETKPATPAGEVDLVERTTREARSRTSIPAPRPKPAPDASENERFKPPVSEEAPVVAGAAPVAAPARTPIDPEAAWANGSAQEPAAEAKTKKTGFGDVTLEQLIGENPAAAAQAVQATVVARREGGRAQLPQRNASTPGPIAERDLWAWDPDADPLAEARRTTLTPVPTASKPAIPAPVGTPAPAKQQPERASRSGKGAPPGESQLQKRFVSRFTLEEARRARGGADKPAPDAGGGRGRNGGGSGRVDF